MGPTRTYRECGDDDDVVVRCRLLLAVVASLRRKDSFVHSAYMLTFICCAHAAYYTYVCCMYIHTRIYIVHTYCCRFYCHICQKGGNKCEILLL